jgi:hypothetical protein
MIAAFFSSVLAVEAKEAAVVIPLLLTLFELTNKTPASGTREKLVRLLPFYCISAAYTVYVLFAFAWIIITSLPYLPWKNSSDSLLQEVCDVETRYFHLPSVGTAMVIISFFRMVSKKLKNRRKPDCDGCNTTERSSRHSNDGRTCQCSGTYRV